MPIYGADPERDSQLKCGTASWKVNGPGCLIVVIWARAATVKERRNPSIPNAKPNPTQPSEGLPAPRIHTGAAPTSDSKSHEPTCPNPVPVSSNDRLQAAPESHEAARSIPSQQWQTGEPNPSDTRYGASNSDDGSFYFDGDTFGGHQHKDFLSTTSSVVRGVTAFAAAVSGEINVPRDKTLGLAKFLLGIGVPGDAKDFFNQVEALAFPENMQRFLFIAVTKGHKPGVYTSWEEANHQVLDYTFLEFHGFNSFEHACSCFKARMSSIYGEKGRSGETGRVTPDGGGCKNLDISGGGYPCRPIVSCILSCNGGASCMA
ncbi:uncharacterized protein LOC130934778 [Arachis stenosperma]|uniref:uncharacterized protein LOC130934778 n=1 Tax=Arachis stenosperma TaxID=217475 RepID=UPI0025AB7BDC|nr:uncharacterized protein LOC130934778 [Arachis stenosperma]